MTKFSDGKKAYAHLKKVGREIADLHSIEALLGWDERTMIPASGHEHRGDQSATLAGIIHEKTVDPRRGEALDVCEADADWTDPDSPEAADVREWRREYDRKTRIPKRLATALAKAAVDGQSVWEWARPMNDWPAFLPKLTHLFSLKREEAQAVGGGGEFAELYDALLDEFEPGLTTAQVEPVFARLKPALSELLERILAAPIKPDPSILNRPYPIEAQEALCRQAVEAIGYDFSQGRMDRTAHPFETRIAPGDVRITTRFAANDFSESFFSALHEAGHALYEMGLDPDRFGTPGGESVSLGIHESQSRLWENMVGRSRGFWEFWRPIAAARFPDLEKASPEALLLAINEVKPGYIRTESDEVTYNLHVLLRFEIETALFRGELALADLPEAWNAKIAELLGLPAPDLAHGVMQDVHWSGGAFGYFPTYTLGNLNAAMLYAAAERDLGALEPAFARGEYAPLLQWLREKVHRHGMHRRPAELIRRATGEDFSAEPYLAYVTRKYEALYSL